MIAAINNLAGMLAKADGTIKAYVWIFVFGPIIVGVLYVLYLIIMGICSFFGWGSTHSEPEGNESSSGRD